MENLINKRVSVEKILTEEWHSPMIMRNAIIKSIDYEKERVHIVTDEKTTYETYNIGGCGHYYLSAFKIQLENEKAN